MTDEEIFKQALAALPRFTEEQKATLKRALSQQRDVNKTQAKAKREIDPSYSRDWLFMGVAMAMRRKGLISSSGVGFLTLTDGYQTYRKQRDAIKRELELLLPPNDRTRRSRRLVLGQIIGMALIRWCVTREKRQTIKILIRKGYSYTEALQKIKGFVDQEISPGYLLSQIPHAIEALESSFPGYIEANLFHFVLKGIGDPGMD